MLHHKGLKKKVIELVFEEILSQELMQSFFLNEVKEETTKENLWVTLVTQMVILILRIILLIIRREVSVTNVTWLQSYKLIFPLCNRTKQITPYKLELL